MSFHHLGYEVVKSGFTFDRPTDYGHDAFIVTFDARRQVENGNMFVQLKATDKVRLSSDGKRVLFRIDKRDVDFWRSEIFPVYLVVFDASNEVSYWVYLQEYFERRSIGSSTMKAQTIQIELDRRQVVNQRAIASWRRDKAAVLARIGN